MIKNQPKMKNLSQKKLTDSIVQVKFTKDKFAN